MNRYEFFKDQSLIQRKGEKFQKKFFRPIEGAPKEVFITCAVFVFNLIIEFQYERFFGEATIN